MESIRQSYINTVNELNQELLAMKEAYEQLDNEKQNLVGELEKQMKSAIGMFSSFRNRLYDTRFCVLVKTPSAIIQQPFEQVSFQSVMQYIIQSILLVGSYSQ